MTVTQTLHVESGRVHLYRVDGDPDWGSLSGRRHVRDSADATDEPPRYVVQVIDLHDEETFLLPAQTLNVNGAAFAFGDGSVEYGAGAYKTVRRDNDNPGLVRIRVQQRL
jgi:hypothetical protein